MTTKTTKKEDEKKIATPSGRYDYANGKRKSAVAKVRLYKGKGVITINDRAIDDYFALKTLIARINSPLKITGTTKTFDITVKVVGGGNTAQAEAIRHGIAKALVEIDSTNKPSLKKAGLLTRDSRVKERKKFGLKRARKAPQFSKR